VYVPVPDATGQNKVAVDTTEYNLSEESLEALDTLQAKLEAAEVLNAVLAIAPFAQMIGGLDDAAVTVTSFQWEKWAETVGGLEEWQRHELGHFCDLQAASQTESRDDHLFWREMSKSFLSKGNE